jgi:hypothetical protein
MQSKIETKAKGTPPVAKWRDGVIEISKWEKDGKMSYSLKKSYNDKATKEWKTTSTYFDNQLVQLKELLEKVISGEGLVNTRKKK